MARLKTEVKLPGSSWSGQRIISTESSLNIITHMDSRSFIDKCRVWFTSTADKDILEEELEELRLDQYGSLLRSGEEPTEMADPEHEFIREEVRNNRRMINEVRVRVSRVDERTSFIAKIVFGVFIAMLVSIGGGLILAFAFM